MSRAVKISWAVGGAVIASLLAVALAIAVLGDSEGGDDAEGSNDRERSTQRFPGGGPPAGVNREELQAFRDCLEDNGVELPDPRSGGGGAPPAGPDGSDPDIREGFSQCQDKLPEGAGPPGRAPSF